MIKRAKHLARRGVSAYVRTVRDATPNARRYLLVVVLQNVALGTLGTVFALYVRARGMSPAVVGDVEGALALAAGIVCLLLPPLVSAVGYRRLLVVAGLAFAVSRLGQTADVGASAIIALGLALGLGDGIMRFVGVTFLSENGPQDPHERTMLFTADFVARIAASFVGSIIGGLLPAALELAIGEVSALRWTMGVAGLLYVASVLPIFGIAEKPRPQQGAWSQYMCSVREFRSWDRLVRLSVPEGIIAFGAGLIMPFVPLFLRVEAGATVPQIGLILGAASVVMAAATLATPLLARKLGLVGTVVVTELASLPFLLVIPLSGSLPVIVAAMWARGALMNMSWPVYNQMAVEGVPTRDKPLVVGWTGVAWSVAWLLGSTVGGRLAESSYSAGYFITAALYATGAVCSWILLRGVHLKTPGSAEGLPADAAEIQA